MIGGESHQQELVEEFANRLVLEKTPAKNLDGRVV